MLDILMVCLIRMSMFKNLPQSLHFEELNFSSTYIFQKIYLPAQSDYSLLLPLYTPLIMENNMFAKHNSIVDVDQINPKL
jgi:hypothetical protein